MIVETVAGRFLLFICSIIEQRASGSGVKFVAHTVSIHNAGSSPGSKENELKIETELSEITINQYNMLPDFQINRTEERRER